MVGLALFAIAATQAHEVWQGPSVERRDLPGLLAQGTIALVETSGRRVFRDEKPLE